MLLFLSIYVISVLGFIVHLFVLPRKLRKKKKIIELALLYQIVFSLGLTSLFAFFGLTFMSEYVAILTEWDPSPFEQQVANINLGFALLGFLAIYLRGHFWTATILGFSVWILGDGIQHLYHYLVKGNASSGNIGVPLYTDLIVPIVLLILLKIYLKEMKIAWS